MLEIDATKVIDDERVKFKVETGKLRNLRLFLLNVFCGFSSQEQDQVALNEQEIDESNRRKETFFSLSQTRFEHYILNINLVVILVVAVVFYIFFSIPPEYHIFQHVHLNRTWLNSN